MKVISFIERHQSEVIEKILRHCGMWKETPPRAPPVEISYAPLLKLKTGARSRPGGKRETVAGVGCVGGTVEEIFIVDAYALR